MTKVLRWLRRRWELVGLEGAARLKVKAHHWQEDGYEGHEVVLLVAADVLGLPYGQLYEHEAWVRRWRREDVLTRQQVRDAGLWLANCWAVTDPEQQPPPLSTYPKLTYTPVHHHSL